MGAIIHCRQVVLKHCQIQHAFANTTAVSEVEYKSEPKHAKDNPYLALMVDFWEKKTWLRYNGTALHFVALYDFYFTGGVDLSVDTTCWLIVT